MFRFDFTTINVVLFSVLLCGASYAQDLDDLTMKVIGLEEIPGDSFQIEIPEAALGDIADLNEVNGGPSLGLGGDAIVATPGGGEDTAEPER